MGTNYYARIDDCKCCDQYDEVALGKSSGGWCFTLHIYPEKGINTLEDLLEVIADNPIYNEYGGRVSKKEFTQIVTERSWPTNQKDYDFNNDNEYYSLEHFLSMNHAELGPNNLLRHKIDGHFCIGHGEGTWDYCIGEFS